MAAELDIIGLTAMRWNNKKNQWATTILEHKLHRHDSFDPRERRSSIVLKRFY